jgi:hypothetical protein
MGDRDLREAAIQAATGLDPRFDRIADLAVAEHDVDQIPEVTAKAEERVAALRARAEERIARIKTDLAEQINQVWVERDTEVAQRRIAHHDAYAAARRYWKPSQLSALNHPAPRGRRPTLPKGTDPHAGDHNESSSPKESVDGLPDDGDAEAHTV